MVLTELRVYAELGGPQLVVVLGGCGTFKTCVPATRRESPGMAPEDDNALLVLA